MKPAAWITDDLQLARVCEASDHRITSSQKSMTYLVHLVPVSAIREETSGTVENLARGFVSTMSNPENDFLLRVAATPGDSETIARYLLRTRNHGTDRTRTMTVTWAPDLNDAVAHAQKIVADAENNAKKSESKIE